MSLSELKRMCNSYDFCADCPLYDWCEIVRTADYYPYLWEDSDVERVEMIVDKWIEGRTKE